MERKTNFFNIFKKPVSHRDAILKKAVEFMEKQGYNKAKILGSGSYGDVFAAKCSKRKEKVAVKVVTTLFTSEMESSLWKTFQHKNIMPLYDSFKTVDFECFVMPLLHKPMDEILTKTSFKKKPAALSLCLNLLRDVVSGVQYLHSRDICHLDIKDNNVLVTSDMRAVLADFSCVKTTREHVNRYGLTAILRPPECWYAPDEDEPAVDGKSFDVWAVGMLTLSAFTGKDVEKEITKWMVKELGANVDPEDIECLIENSVETAFPFMKRTLKHERFCSVMKSAFPKSRHSEEFQRNVRNFIFGTLRYRPEDRPSVFTLASHSLFQEQGLVISPDELWVEEVHQELDLLVSEENDEETGYGFEASLSGRVAKPSVPEDAASYVLSQCGDVSERNALPSGDGTGHCKPEIDDDQSRNNLPPEKAPCDDFTAFAQSRAKVISSIPIGDQEQGPSDTNRNAEEGWTACFGDDDFQPKQKEGITTEATMQNPKKKKVGFIGRIRAWFRKRTRNQAN